jgi:hypothetical protein
LGVPESPKSFTPRLLAKILWDFAYLCWANPVYTKRSFKDAVVSHRCAIPVNGFIDWETEKWVKR